jgi:ribosomal protein S18 acetylase RimI-like enzyme
MRIRPFGENDLLFVAEIHAHSFPRQCFSKDWIKSLSRSYPRSRIFVADSDGKILGYAVWTEKSGFRKEVVLELEQIAVEEISRGKSIGRSLIEQSLEMVKECLSDRGSCLKAVLISTRSDNPAQKLYEHSLGAEPIAAIPGLYSADEVLMLRMYKDLPELLK